LPGGGGIHFPLGTAAPTPGAEPRLPLTSKRALDPVRLERPVSDLPGVGRVTARRLAGLGLRNVGELLLHVPFRHEPPARLLSIASLRIGEDSTVRARVVSCGVRTTHRRGLKILEALLDDGGTQTVAVWYNQDYLENALRDKPEILVRGSLTRAVGGSRFVVRSHEILGPSEEGGLHTLGLVPVYPSTGDLSVRTLRNVLRAASPEAMHFVDPVPAAVLASRRFAGKAEALLAFHFPRDITEATRARARLAFEELLLLQMAVWDRRRRGELNKHAPVLSDGRALVSRFLTALPFAPTQAQCRVMAEIDADLERDIPMRRLLQGDVGSGKTLVATYCLLRAVDTQGQAALMAPTEVLAEQHASRLRAQLAPLGLEVGLLTGSVSQRTRRSLLGALADGSLPIVVGTHALIQDGVCFRRLAVAVVDEQHRFGVHQRDVLSSLSAELSPHVLHMTATPIPRTLSLTLYGDLDVSVIDEMPPGRTPVRTNLVFPEHRERAWEFVRGHMDRGHQVYVVCPLVEESTAVEEEIGEGRL
jgi:ATP-dependent DNA helicase RecG